MSWIADYLAFTEADNTSPLFKQWAAVFAVASAVQRKCWMKSLGRKIYPNLYVFLIGPSAAGKGVALEPLTDVLAELDHQYIAPASVTAASLADELEEAFVTVLQENAAPMQFHALTVISREFGVFLPAYDTVLLNTLTDLWDNKGYDERRRGRGKRLTIKDATLNLIGGTTPAYLTNTLPDNAWEEGFMSRSIIVYSGAQPPVQITEEVAARVGFKECLKGLERIARRTGQVRWSPAALGGLNSWLMQGCPPAPTHPKLTTYNQRRIFNTMKLSLIFALAAGHPKVEPEDVQQAIDLLLSTEQTMPDAFKAMKSGGDQQAIKELWHFMYVLHAKSGKPIHKSKLVHFLHDKIPAHNIDRVILVMEQAGLIRPAQGGCFTPIKPEV